MRNTTHHPAPATGIDNSFCLRRATDGPPASRRELPSPLFAEVLGGYGAALVSFALHVQAVHSEKGSGDRLSRVFPSIRLASDTGAHPCVEDLKVECIRPIEGQVIPALRRGDHPKPDEAFEFIVPVNGEGWWVYMDPRRE